MEEEYQIKSKYSSGINIILRLDTLWKDTHLHSRANLFYHWNNDLDCIWRELARDLSKEQYIKWCGKIDDIDDELKKLGGFKDHEPDGFQKVSDSDMQTREKHYKLLNNKQLILARLENHLGKGTTEEDEEEDDFD